MRAALCLVVLAAATACGSGEPGARVERYGISLEVPDGWAGEVSRGIVRIHRGDVSVALHEYETARPGEAAYFKRAWPVRLAAADFERRHDQDDTALLYSVSGRLFSVFPAGSEPAPAELTELNAALAGIEVERGDFYPGTVEPVAFRDRPGWHTISSGPTPRYAYGESAQAAAATIPLRDEPNELPPRRTLEALPRDGIVAVATVSRTTASLQAPRRAPPYRLADFEGRIGWEGQVGNLPEYVLWATTGDRYFVDLRVYFGRAQPTAAMLAEADAVVSSIRFPDWGPWELD